MSRILTTSSLTLLVVAGAISFSAWGSHSVWAAPQEAVSASVKAGSANSGGATAEQAKANGESELTLVWGPLNIVQPEKFLTQENFERPKTLQEAARFVVDCINRQSFAGLQAMRANHELYAKVLHPKFDNVMSPKPARISWLMIESESVKEANRCLVDFHGNRLVMEGVEEEGVTGYGEFILHYKPKIWCIEATGRYTSLDVVGSFVEYKGEFYVLGYVD